MSVFNLPIATFIPRRAIASFTGYVTIREICTDDLEITEHPIEQGASISDHAYVKPAMVNAEIRFGRGLSTLSIEDPTETYAKLLQLQASREPFTLITGKRAYQNMLIKTLVETNDVYTESILSVRFVFQQIFVVSTSSTTFSLPENQAQPQSTEGITNAGEKTPQKVTGSTYDGAVAVLLGI